MPITLLLADDSVVIQKLVGLSFANEDIELVAVDNGDDAISRARECKPDIVLADVVMPGKSGYEVCSEIRNNPELADTPVLLLTGTFEAFDESRATDVGATGHITKPFEAQALVDRVHQLLAEQTPAAETSQADASASNDFFDDNVSHLGESVGGMGGAETFAITADDLGDELLPDAAVTPIPSEPAPVSTEAPNPDQTLFVDDFFSQPEAMPDPGDFSDDPKMPSADLEVPSLDATMLANDIFGSGPDISGAGELDDSFETGLTDPVSSPMPASQALDIDFGSAHVPDSIVPDNANDYDVSTSDLRVDPTHEDPGWSEGIPAGVVTEPAPIDTPKVKTSPPAPATEVAAAPVETASLDEARPDLTPAMQDRIHDTVEKVAWEAFSDISDDIVRQLTKRVEQIAWEVIPQMAETLIQDEIRRMKGQEGEESED